MRLLTVKLSTLESEAYNQAMFMCKKVNVKEGDKLRVRCQMERGLLSSHSKVTKKASESTWLCWRFLNLLTACLLCPTPLVNLFLRLMTNSLKLIRPVCLQQLSNLNLRI
jgi:hypothetical protein